MTSIILFTFAMFVVFTPEIYLERNIGPAYVDQDGEVTYEDMIKIEIIGMFWALISSDKFINVTWEHSRRDKKKQTITK